MADLENVPVYSHGGSAKDGTVTGNGDPIDVSNATSDAAMYISIDVGSAIVKMQSHPGPLRNGATLDERDWRDHSNGGWTITPGDAGGVAKTVTHKGVYYRTVIVDIQGGGEVRSMIPALHSEGTGTVAAKNPGAFFHTPYNR